MIYIMKHAICIFGADLKSNMAAGSVALAVADLEGACAPRPPKIRKAYVIQR
jgi:hypothetical protein